jgi:hypothetical protein
MGWMREENKFRLTMNSDAECAFVLQVKSELWWEYKPTQYDNLQAITDWMENHREQRVPTLFLASNLAPLSTRRLTHSVWPNQAAHIRAVIWRCMCVMRNRHAEPYKIMRKMIKRYHNSISQNDWKHICVHTRNANACKHARGTHVVLGILVGTDIDQHAHAVCATMHGGSNQRCVFALQVFPRVASTERSSM